MMRKKKIAGVEVNAEYEPRPLSEVWRVKLCEGLGCRYASKGFCLMGVPYYCVSYDCMYFEETPETLEKSLEQKSYRYIKKYLVDTL
jgi:hypothetical protein